MNWRPLIILCLSVIIPIGSFLYFKNQETKNLREIFAVISLPTMILLHFLLAQSIKNLLKLSFTSIKKLLRNHRVALGFLLFIFALTMLKIPNQIRVLSDEANLISIGHSFYHQHKPVLNTHGRYSKGKYWPIVERDPKRPVAYGFLIACGHWMFGENWQYGFWINNIMLLIFMILSYLLLAENLPKTSALSMVLLISSHSLVLTTAMSSGFDFFSLAFFAVIIWGWRKFSENEDPTWARFLIISWIFSFYLRYEYVLFSTMVVGSLLVTHRKTVLSYLKENSVFILISATLTLCRICQHFLTKDKHAENWKKSTLSLSYLPENLEDFLDGIFSFSASPYNSLALTLLAVLAIMGFRFFKDELKKLKGYHFVLCLVWATATTLYLSHYFGKPLHPTGSRYFLIPIVGLSLLFIPLSKAMMSRHPFPVIIAAMAIFFHGASIAERDPFSATLPLVEKTNKIYKWIDQNLSKENSLIIAERPGHYVIKGYSATNFSKLRKKQYKYRKQYKEKRYNKVVAIQRIYKKTGKPFDTTKLPNNWDQNIILEFHYNAKTFVRFSEIKPGSLKKVDQEEKAL